MSSGGFDLSGQHRTLSIGIVAADEYAAGGKSFRSAMRCGNRPVRWLIGFPAGGAVDLVARIVSQWLSERFGQQFIVENRGGSGGNLAAAAAVTSPRDGYTLLFVAPNNAISTSLYKISFGTLRRPAHIFAALQPGCSLSVV